MPAGLVHHLHPVVIVLLLEMRALLLISAPNSFIANVSALLESFPPSGGFPWDGDRNDTSFR